MLFNQNQQNQQSASTKKTLMIFEIIKVNKEKKNVEYFVDEKSVDKYRNLYLNQQSQQRIPLVDDIRELERNRGILYFSKLPKSPNYALL